MPKHLPQFLNTEELAQRWGVSRAHIRNLYSMGHLPGVLVGNSTKRIMVRFRLADIEQWEKQRTSE